MESTRAATEADRGRCAALLEEARAEAAAQRGGAQFLERTAANTSLLDRWLAGDGADGDPPHRVFVGEFEGAVVGTAGGHVDGRRGHVDWCYVEEGARGVGVGAALVGELTRWFTESGCTDMEAVALPGDRSTKQLYETSGLKARLLVMHRSLP